MRDGALPAAMAALAIAAAGCSDVPSSPDEPFSLEFERLPFPAVVVGDVLRDSTGAPAALLARAFNIDGSPIAGAPITYALVGTGATLLPGNGVRGDTAGREVRVTAIVNGVPSLPRTLTVVQRPDTLAGPETAPPALTYGVPPNPSADRSEPITVRVLARPAGAPVAGVPSWVVRYRLVVRGDTLAPGDSTLLWLVDDAGRASALDTTDAQGTASRRVQVNGLNPAIDGLDSVVVSVTAQGTATPLRGAPVRIALPVRRRQ